MERHKMVILCNEIDDTILENGEYLAAHRDGYEIVVSLSVPRGIVKIYDELGYEETVELY